jgi:biopolymer transport protein ExbD
MRELRDRKRKNELTEEQFKEQSKEIRDDKDGQVVVIKPTSEATYKNLIDALDEMAISSIAKYAVVDMQEGDQFLLENLKTQGAYGANAAPPKN